MTRAIGLLSGGLDSILAVKLLTEQDVEVLAISFVTPFFGAEKGRRAAERLGVSFRAIDITDEHLEMLKHPRHGYGRNMNPCIDCHALMLNIAGEVMEGEGCDFLFTGEVLGERPKSQNRQALDIVAKESGYADLILRPLSAKLLPPTKPEREGLIDRERLMDIQGRSRKPQMALAEKYGITDYPSPAGGCLLTDPGYSRRLKELFEHDADPSADDVRLLSVGRHLRLSQRAKLVLGRNHNENEKLQALIRTGDTKLHVRDIPGPIGLLRGQTTDDINRHAAAITARYSDAPAGAEVPVRLVTDGNEETLHVVPADPESVRSLLV